MTTTMTIYDAFAVVLAYPNEEFHAALDSCRALTGESLPEAAEKLDGFAEKIGGLPIEDLEELYTRTFDINPVAALEIGWHLHGETYERGAFLVRVRKMLREHGIEECGELPDHLIHVLPLLGVLPPDAKAEFIRENMLPALKKIIAGFEGKENPYEAVVIALQTVLENQTE